MTPQASDTVVSLIICVLQRLVAEQRDYSAWPERIANAMDAHLWNSTLGYYVAYNHSHGGHQVDNRVFLMGLPLWAGLASSAQAQRVAVEIARDDLLGDYGLRSVSRTDPRYSNVNEIKPYSNWRGPIWINANAMVAYGLERYGFKTLANTIAQRVVAALAGDLNRWVEGTLPLTNVIL